jgi:uncharacterized damage-inducible protein DinB
MTEPLKQDLHDSRERLFRLISGMGEEQFRHTPAGEEWNIAAHLAHLLRIERLFAERAHAAIERDEPFMPSTRVQNDDDPAKVQHLAVPQIIHGMQAARRDLEQALDAAEGRMDRAIIHERIGRMTIEQIMRKMTDHEQEHGDAIERLAKLASAARPVSIPLMQRT